MFAAEALRFSIQALRANLVRSLLTALGMVIGNASVILVVTISLTSQSYIIDQIQAIGSNMIWAYYEAGNQTGAKVEGDFINLRDVAAVREQLGSQVIAVTGVMQATDRMIIGGKEEDVTIIGSDEHYGAVRNLVTLSGRLLDSSDVELRQKVAMMTDKLALRLYGSLSAAIGQTIKLYGLQFTVVGVFRERVDSFGQTELARETVLIPVTVQRYFVPVQRIDPLYVQVRSAQEVERLTGTVKQILERRHRVGAKYRVENLAAILGAAKNIALILSIVLVLVSAIALVISGIGIMNIMLVTVTERTREIGLRMSIGASRREILLQFLAEAVIISLAGGSLGILAGVAVPLSVRIFADGIYIPISITSIVVAFAVSCLVGLVFGLLPASRASRLSPTEALRYE